MDGLGESIYQEGREEGIAAFILDNLEEGIPRERILEKLQRRFQLTESEAEEYLRLFWKMWIYFRFSLQPVFIQYIGFI